MDPLIPTDKDGNPLEVGMIVRLPGGTPEQITGIYLYVTITNEHGATSCSPESLELIDPFGPLGKWVDAHGVARRRS